MNKPAFNRPLQEKTHEIPDDEIPQSPRNILLVEDDHTFAEHLRLILESHKFVVTQAVDGVDGLKKIMAADFDVVLCDMLMPNLPGDMFFMAVERTKPALTKRFIFITGHQSDPKVAAFLKRVRGLCLFKPFQMHELLDMIQIVLKKSAA